MTEEMNYFDKTDERETISRNPNSVVALKDEIESLRAQLEEAKAQGKKMEEAIKWVLKIHSDPTLGHEAISMEWLNDLEDSLQITKEKHD